MPKASVIDGSIPKVRRDAMSPAARRCFTFWNTGDVNYAKAALAPEFLDRDLPPGRPQGLTLLNGIERPLLR